MCRGRDLVSVSQGQTMCVEEETRVSVSQTMYVEDETESV